MKIQHFRNATMVIEIGKKVLLVDPMIGPKGTIPTFTILRFKPRKNPIVPLPTTCNAILKKVTHCLITHQHPDHLDKEGERFLIKNKIPVICSINDEKTFRKKGLNIVQTVNYWQRKSFLEVGEIEGIPARHGYGIVAKTMGNVMGFYIKFPNEPSLYLSSDTIYTDDVKKVLKAYQPDICVVACGSAQLDVFKPLLMNMEDILKFIQDAPNKVIANHLEAVNHCPTTRKNLKTKLKEHALAAKTYIPEDGDWMDFG